MDQTFESKTAAILKAFAALNFRPSKVVASRELYREAREACIHFVNVADVPIVLRAHPSIPDDIVVVFGSGGTFEVFKLEDQCEAR